MSELSQSAKAIEEFKDEVLKGNIPSAQKKLDKLKVELSSRLNAINNLLKALSSPICQEAILDCDSLPPVASNSLNSQAEQALAREILEYAVILSIKSGDKISFQRYLSSLRPYYTATRDAPDTEIKCTILGLNLLYLLVENRLADFHCELELLTQKQQEHPAILFCTRLDQHLMVGSYDQVMAEAALPPVESYTFFLKSLLETVRINIGECAAASYSALTIEAATKILMFQNEKETIAFVSANYPEWSIVGRTIETKGSKTSKLAEIPSLKLISQNLSYATELERIV